jgi:hypothetical protein
MNSREPQQLAITATVGGGMRLSTDTTVGIDDGRVMGVTMGIDTDHEVNVMSFQPVLPLRRFRLGAGARQDCDESQQLLDRLLIRPT